MTQYPGWADAEMGLFGSITHSCRSQAHTHRLPLSPARKSQAKKIYLGAEICCPRGGRGSGEGDVKYNCNSSALQCIQTHVFCSRVLETWLPQRLSHPRVIGDFLGLFSRDSQATAKGAGAGSWATAGSTAPIEACQLIPVGKTPPRSRDVWCWTPQLPQRHLCPRLDAKLLLLKGRIRTRDILVMLLTLC